MRAGLIFLLCVLSPGLGAQDILNYPLIPGNRDKMELVFKELASHPVIQGDFLLTKNLQSLKRQFKSEGRLVFESTSGILWEIQKPVSSLTIVGPKGYVQRSPNGKITRVSGSENQTFQKFSWVIQSVFEGNQAIIDKEFQLYFRSTGGQWTVGLVPKDQTLARIVKLLILSGSKNLEKLSLVEKTGDSVVYDFISITYPREISASDKEKFKL